jgi:hypothetical protein
MLFMVFSLTVLAAENQLLTLRIQGTFSTTVLMFILTAVLTGGEVTKLGQT